jgi:hypothetical protein
VDLNVNLDNDWTKWCRRCQSNGQWDTVYSQCSQTFSKMKCNPLVLGDADYFVSTKDGKALNDTERRELAIPGSIAAIYRFGKQKFCKICLDNGQWSNYPEFQTCNAIKSFKQISN